MKSNNNTETLENLLLNTGLARPLPEKIVKFRNKARKKTHIAILKKAGKYTFYTAIIIYLSYSIKSLLSKLGIAYSIKNIVITSTLALSVSATGTVATIKGVSNLIDKIYIKEEENAKNEIEEKVVTDSEIVPENKTEPKKAAYIAPKILLKPFKSNVSRVIENRANSIMISEFRKIGGKHLAGFPVGSISYQKQEINAKYLLEGFIIKSGEKPLLQLKVKDASGVIFFYNEHLTSFEELFKELKLTIKEITKKTGVK